MKSWTQHVEGLAVLLRELVFLNGDGKELAQEEAFAWWHAATASTRDTNGTVYLIGNGASASMASHFAADLAKNGHLHTEVFSDLSLITAISNDMGYENVFAEPLKRRVQPCDLLVAISSSGGSVNILRAVDVAREAGTSIVTLSAMDEQNALRRLGSLNAYVPAETYGYAETCHTAILHYWMDSMEISGAGEWPKE